MESGIRIMWGKIVPGREREGLTLFQDTVSYFGSKLGEKKITFFEPFFVRNADQGTEDGFFVLKGPVAEIFKILEEETYKELLTKATFLLEHFKVDLLMCGEEVGEQLKRYEKVLATYGA